MAAIFFMMGAIYYMLLPYIYYPVPQGKLFWENFLNNRKFQINGHLPRWPLYTLWEICIVLRRRDTKESVFDQMLPVDDNGEICICYAAIPSTCPTFF